MKDLEKKERNELVKLIRKVENPVIRLNLTYKLMPEDIIKVVVNETNEDVVTEIYKKIISNKKYEAQVKKNAYRLSKAEDCRIREVAVKYLSIDEFINMAVVECDDYVADEIIRRLKYKEDAEEVKKIASMLLKAINWKIREFIVKFLSIIDLANMAKIEENHYVIHAIFERIKSQKNIKEIAYKFINAKSFLIREYAIHFLSVDDIIEMVEPRDMSYEVYLRIKKEKEKIGKNAYKLSKADNYYIRILATKFLTVDELTEMAICEEIEEVIYAIIKNLEKESNIEETKKNAYKLAKAKDYRIRAFAVRILPFNELIDIAVEEENYNVVNVIIYERLNCQEERDIIRVKNREYPPKLAKAKNCEIRKFIIQFLSVEDLIEMAVNETDYFVADSILIELEKKEHMEEIKKNACRLAKVNYWKIRKFSVKFLSIKELIEMAVNATSDGVENSIFHRLEEEKSTEEIKKNACRLAKANYWEIRKFSVKFLSIKELIEMAVNEIDDKVVYEIYEKLEENKDTDELKKNAYKLTKAKSNIIQIFGTKLLSKNDLIKIAGNNQKETVEKIIGMLD